MENGESSNDSNQIFREWIDLYSDQLYSWAFYKTSRKETAEDLVQDTFVAAMQAYTKFENKSSIKTWLFSILKNKIYDYHRNNFKIELASEKLNSETINSRNNFFDKDEEWINSAHPADWGEPNENLLDNLEFNKALKKCLEKLPPQWNSAIQLKYLASKDGKIICQELGITPTNFWQILHRAKLNLRKCIELNWFNKK